MPQLLFTKADELTSNMSLQHVDMKALAASFCFQSHASLVAPFIHSVDADR